MILIINRIASILLTSWDKHWILSLLLFFFFMLISLSKWVWLVPDNHFDWTEYYINIKKHQLLWSHLSALIIYWSGSVWVIAIRGSESVYVIVYREYLSPLVSKWPYSFLSQPLFYRMTNPFIVVTEITPPLYYYITKNRSLFH